jgi:hypothetical protein
LHSFKQEIETNDNTTTEDQTFYRASRWQA